MKNKKGKGNMQSHIIIVASFTHANKGMNYLRRMRIKARIQKTKSRGNGCSFGIVVHENPERVCHILRGINIQCIEVI